jgi:probable phosphoglycerate mutase
MASRNTTSKPKPPPSTTVLFVRHGVTPTTGQVLPGRAPHLHLAEAGQVQATRVGDRLTAWVAKRQASSTARTPVGDGAPAGDAAAHAGHPGPAGDAAPAGDPAAAAHGGITAVYASPLERTRETAGLIASRLGLRVRIARGLNECDFGEWTGSSLKELIKLPEWTTVQRYPSGFRFPGGESFTGMQARMVETVADLCRRHQGETIVAVSHADPIKAVVADALGTHLDLFQRIVVSPCSVTAISYGPLGPAVLAVNSTASLEELVPS